MLSIASCDRSPVWAHDGFVHRGTGRLTQRDLEVVAHKA